MKSVVNIKKEGKHMLAVLSFDPHSEFNEYKKNIYVKCDCLSGSFRTRIRSMKNGDHVILFNKTIREKLKIPENGIENVEIDINIDEISSVDHTEQLPPMVKDVRIRNIFDRVSIRQFTADPIEKRKLNTILYAGMSAPSAGNKRPFHFIILDDDKKISNIVAQTPYIKIIAGAKLNIVVCGDQIMQPINEYLLADCAAATENMLLAITGLDLGGVWCGIKKDSDLQEIISNELALPSDIIPTAIIACGVVDKKVAAKRVFDQKKVHYNKW